MKKTFLANVFLESATFLGSPPAVRGHWLGLQSYCSRQENGGRIKNARKLSSGEWVMILGAAGGAVALGRMVSCGLAHWDGDDLVADGYDMESQDRYFAQRERGAKGGRAKAARDKGEDIEGQESRALDVSDATGQGDGVATSPERKGSDSYEQGGMDLGPERSSSPPAFVPNGKPKATAFRAGTSGVPQSRDEALALFEDLSLKICGRTYSPSPADTMGLDVAWPDLAREELEERMTCYLNRRDELHSLAGFVGWIRGSPRASFSSTGTAARSQSPHGSRRT